MSERPKRYDERYFRRWYHGPGGGLTPNAELGRKVRLALAAAEYVLARPVRSVLDVGCGEGRWRAPLKRLRPKLAYLGLDPSDWVVRRHGRRRNLRKGGLADLPRLALRRPFDLTVCSDVLHYLPAQELEAGLPALRALTRGVAWIDAFTTEDDFLGDRQGWQPRSARTYRRALTKAGFVPLGPGCWVPKERTHGLSALERS